MRDEKGALIVIYDSGCAFCTAAARWLERHDRRGRLLLEPIADAVDVRGLRLHRAALEEEMHVVDADGRIARGFRGWQRIAFEVPVLCPALPLLSLPGVTPIGDRVYRWVAAHRSWLSRALGLLRCRRCSPR